MPSAQIQYKKKNLPTAVLVPPTTITTPFPPAVVVAITLAVPTPAVAEPVVATVESKFGLIVPVQNAPSGQQATLPLLSCEHTAVVAQHIF